MQQLGANFVNSFLLPYIQKQILGNVNNDIRLQNIIRYDKVVTAEEISGIEADYFGNTGTVLEKDLGLRKAFWREFVSFVARQKKLCNGNVLKLTFRLLPDAKTGSFSNEAQKNLAKFAFIAIDRLENTLIDRKIDKNKLLGRISASQAEKDKLNLKNGKLILVRDKKGDFDYMSNEEIRRAIGNVERTADIMARFATSGDNGLYTFNPLGENKASTLQEVQIALWSKQSMLSEKQLEENGIYIGGHMVVDNKGIARGFAKDRNGIRLKIEFDVKKPGKRVYRITFVNNPNNKFFISEGELNMRFGKNNQSALEVFRDKEKLDGHRTAGLAGTKISGELEGKVVVLPENRKITTIVGVKQEPHNDSNILTFPYIAPVNSKRNKESKGKENDLNAKRRQTTIYNSALEAKKALESRNKNGHADIETRVPANGQFTKKHNRGKFKASQKKQKSFMWSVVKVYVTSFGVLGGLGGILSFMITK